MADAPFRKLGRHNLVTRWPPQFLELEAAARRSRGGIWGVPGIARCYLLVASLLVHLSVKSGARLGSFDPDRYQEEIVRNTDFYKRGMTLAMVFDCPEAGIELLRRRLDTEEAQGRLRYGIQLSDFALMTCFVSALQEGKHVHFIDGGDGGYTFAAKRLKALGTMQAMPA
jgi:hypothetical protein